jgi:hypothetical protein
MASQENNTFVRIGNLIFGLYQDNILITDNDVYTTEYLNKFIKENIPYIIIEYPIDIITSKKYFNKYREDLPTLLTELQSYDTKTKI